MPNDNQNTLPDRLLALASVFAENEYPALAETLREAAAAALSGGEAVAISCSNHKKGETGYCTFLSDVPWKAKLYTTPQPGDGVVVPKRATAAQLYAGIRAMLKTGIDYPSELDADAIYDAMIAAAPSAKGVA